MKLKGANQMVKQIQAIAKAFPVRVEKALYREAQIELTEMKRRTPVDTTENAPHPGQLRNSLTAEVTRKGSRLTAIFATGAQAPYAVYVHENPDAFHPVGQWKYMESVLNESRGYIAARVARRLQMGSKKKS